VPSNVQETPKLKKRKDKSSSDYTARRVGHDIRSAHLTRKDIPQKKVQHTMSEKEAEKEDMALISVVATHTARGNTIDQMKSNEYQRAVKRQSLRDFERQTSAAVATISEVSNRPNCNFLIFE
jgi:hypothetical protein